MRVRSAASAGRSIGLPSSLGRSARSAGSIWCSSTHCLRAQAGGADSLRAMLDVEKMHTTCTLGMSFACTT